METANTPSREAIVMFTRTDSHAPVPSLEFDPIDLPIDSAGMADVFHSGLVGMMDAICDREAIEHAATYTLVWSGTTDRVMGVCPVCDDVFPVSDGFTGDELNEGYEAVCCGCDPSDA